VSAAAVAQKPSRHAVLATGTLVAGRYRVEGVLGEGAHSVVYRSRREPEGADVALKVIHRHLTGDPQVARRFEREAHILRRVEGEHVARMFDFVEDDGLLAIALERVDGVSLEAMLAERAPLDLGAAIEISLQVCAALGAAHANSVVHRDLKTANVLVERKGSGASALRVKVVDFGLGKLVHGDGSAGLTEQGMIFGTADYMAPEQARGDEVDARADLYAVGVMLYEMTVGAPPFSGRTAALTMTAHLCEAPPSPRSVRPEANIPPALEAVMLRVLAKNPADRYTSARELAEAIAAARDTTLVVAPHAVHDPEGLAQGDTDLHLAPPGFANATTLRVDQLACVKDSLPPTRVHVSSRPPPPTMPSPRAYAILEESTVVSGEAPSILRRGRALWVAIAIVAAAIGVVIGALVGTR
jgi:serine/threonine-protein kinase